MDVDSTARSRADVQPDVGRRMSLRTYAFLILAAALAVPTALFGNSQAERWERASRENNDRRLELASYRLAADVSAFMHAQTLSIEAAARVAGALESWDLAMLQDIIDGVYNPQFFSGVFLADAEGTSVVFSPAKAPGDRAGRSYADRSYYQTVRRERRIVMTELVMGKETRTPLTTIASPIISPRGEWRGLVAGGVRQDNLADLVDSFRERTEADRIVILDGKSSVLLDTAEDLRVLQRVSPDHPFATPGTSVARTLTDEQGVQMRAVPNPVELPGEGWTVWIMSPMEVVDAEANLARASSQQFTVGLIVLAFLFALLSSLFVGQQFGRLKSLTRSLGDPEFGASRPPASRWTPREFEELIRTGYDTIERLQQFGLTNRSLVEELKSKEARILPLATAWEHIDDAIEFTTPDGQIEFRNPPAEVLSQLLVGDIPERCEIFQHPKIDSDDFRDTVHRGETWRGELRVEDVRGEVRRLSVGVTPITNARGRIHQFVVIRRDVTDQHLQSQSARRNQRLAALGTMAATVAHEINNPLTYIRANLEDLRDQIGDAPDELAEDAGPALADAIEGTSRVSEIVDRMLSLTRDPKGDEGGACEVRAAVENAVAVAGHGLRHKARLLVFVDEELWIPLPASSLFQILVNLLNNAAHAIDPATSEDHQVIIRGTRLMNERGERVMLSVSDTGRGMSPAVAERIFDPFFTTKQIGEGTGLGLSVCRSLVEAAGGLMTVDSEEGEGTNVAITLPAAAQRDAETSSEDTLALREAEDSSPSLGSDELLLTRPRVLVIDDEPAVGRVVARILREYEVEVITDSAAALDWLSSRDCELIVSDVMMPSISGPRLREIVIQRRPEYASRWVFISGGIFDPEVQASLDTSGITLLRKPLAPERLRREAQRILSREVNASS